jgi:hypothetical protein
MFERQEWILCCENRKTYDLMSLSDSLTPIRRCPLNDLHHLGLHGRRVAERGLYATLVV